MIRAAKAGDIPALVKLMVEAHRNSARAEAGAVDEKAAKEILLAMIIRNGGRGINGTHCLVAERDGPVVGMLFGAKQRIQLIGDRWEATDVFFLMGKGATPFMAPAMMESFLAWARMDSRVHRAFLGATDQIGDWRKTAEMYQRCGFTQCGGFFEKTFDRAQRSAA